ncbi:MAG: Sua5/YciO/YrdC/YwlC family protein [Aliivibrio sp.]|uniref:Sua5/YciO/YrdC/YwlC family protein n=1 Tax=Aliivibrio sp. TaxID=1872443 RepID=UPI001A541D57|nr:Sua5/YciO/YrdC/YwlC family protein [Aliivibrio sp.]
MENLKKVVTALNSGEVIAYPTEGVFGVGCDPTNEQAIQKLLNLKQRPSSKGLILIAANIEQLNPYIEWSAISVETQQRILSTWPGPVTWVMPIKPNISKLLCGQFNSIAVRVTDHVDVQQLCCEFGGAITSTSANLTTMPPCRTVAEVEQQFNRQQVTILHGVVGDRETPTEIRDALTGNVLRPG